MDNLEGLGLDAVKVVNSFPVAISLAPESVQEKIENLKELGLDAVKVVNSFPATISYAPESVRAKMDNLEGLGLDAVKVVNSFPVAIGYASEKIRKFTYALKRANIWEATRKEINNGNSIGVLSTPVESLYLELGDTGSLSSASSARTYSKKTYRATAAERRKLIHDRVGTIENAKKHRKFANNLGAILLLKIMRGK